MVSINVLIIEFFYVFIKFYRVLCCASIVLFFLPYTNYHSRLATAIRSTTKPYFKFLRKKMLHYTGLKRIPTLRKWRYLFFFVSICILNIIIKHVSKFLSFFENKTVIKLKI